MRLYSTANERFNIWASLKIHFCPVSDNMLVEKQRQKYICPARDKYLLLRKLSLCYYS
ncbi:MAG: hypothetical protein LBP59_16995 [Planctomycetaceae bacterium]|nr:hypothetical protein [Planctomycetaceae bacterium]